MWANLDRPFRKLLRLENRIFPVKRRWFDNSWTPGEVLLHSICDYWNFDMGVSKNSGTPKSSILIGFSLINHPFWGTPIFGNTHILFSSVAPISRFFSTAQHAVNVWSTCLPQNTGAMQGKNNGASAHEMKRCWSGTEKWLPVFLGFAMKVTWQCGGEVNVKHHLLFGF